MASKDGYPTLYNAEVRVQKHRQEMIDELKDMVKELLIKFYKSTRKKPERIIFYRDGVSEGQFRDVLIHELSSIQRACLELPGDYTPAITFIVVQKRHHARFFAVNPRDQIGKSKNIPAGALVFCFIAKRHLLERFGHPEGGAKGRPYIYFKILPKEHAPRLPNLLYHWQHLPARTKCFL